MTKSEILKQIEELREQGEELSEVKNIIRTLPIEDEKYIYINSINLGYYDNSYLAEEDSSIGNYFKSKEDAEMVIRAMKLEQAIRIRRIELNDGWEPDWSLINIPKYTICGTKYAYPDRTSLSVSCDDTYYNTVPIFGYYKSIEIAQQVIDEFKEELLWYFTEYYPNKDRMYVWGD